MIQISKINLILILIAIISIGIAIGTIVKDKKTDPIPTSMEIKTIPKPDIVSNTTATVNENSSSDIFDKSLNSPETADFIKKLIKEYFQNELSKSSNGKLLKPFGMKIINIPANIDSSTLIDKQNRSEEAERIIENMRSFNYETVASVVDNFQLVYCEKGISHNSKIVYTCGFILPSMDGTGLNTNENRVPQNFKVTVVKEEYGYRMAYID